MLEQCCQGLGCLTVGSEINDCAAAVWCLSTFKSSQDVILCPIYAILPLNDTGQITVLQLLKQTHYGRSECTFQNSLFYQVTQQKLNEFVTWFACKQPLVSIVWHFDSVVSDVSVWHGESVYVCVLLSAVVCGDVGLTGMDCSPDLPV